MWAGRRADAAAKGRRKDLYQLQGQEFWAVKDISFQLKRGESIYPNSSRSERTAASARRISAQPGKKVQRAKATNIQKKVEKKRRKETQSASKLAL